MITIKTLYDQIEDAVGLADAGLTMYTVQQVVTIAYLLVFLTDQLPEACLDWKQTTIEHKIRANFKIDFGVAFNDRAGDRLCPTNANHAIVVKDYAAETAVVIGDLTNVAVQNQATVQDLTQNLSEANEQLATALATIDWGWRGG